MITIAKSSGNVNPDDLSSSTQTKTPQLDPAKIAAAAQAALRITRNDPTIIVTVRKNGGAA